MEYNELREQIGMSQERWEWAGSRCPAGAASTQATSGADGFAATISTLRPLSGHERDYERAGLIRDVIDAFRRLRNSVERFERMLAQGEATTAQPAASLQPLLLALSKRADAARFARQRELKRAIRDARRLDKTRDALFGDAFCLDTDALRRTVGELERLDAVFVGLGVGHVLEQHAARAGAAKETRASSRETQRPARADTALRIREPTV